MQEQSKIWKSWINKPLIPDEYKRIRKKLQLNKKETALLEEEPETATRMSLSRWQALLDMDYKDQAAQMNWWIFFNILTQFTTHRIQSEDRRVQLEERMRTALYAA